jgi:hypothetical protein
MAAGTCPFQPCEASIYQHQKTQDSKGFRLKPVGPVCVATQGFDLEAGVAATQGFDLEAGVAAAQGFDLKAAKGLPTLYLGYGTQLPPFNRM